MCCLRAGPPAGAHHFPCLGVISTRGLRSFPRSQGGQQQCLHCLHPHKLPLRHPQGALPGRAGPVRVAPGVPRVPRADGGGRGGDRPVRAREEQAQRRVEAQPGAGQKGNMFQDLVADA